MATEIINAPLGELRAANLYMYGSSVSAGGTPLTTTATHIHLPPNTKFLSLMPRNFTTAVVARFLKNPYLRILKTADNFVTMPLDASAVLQDSSTSTSLDMSSFDTLANGDQLWVGSHIPFAGVMVDIGNANGGSNAALTVTYWNGSSMVTISATDNTSSGSKTFAVDGLVTWTVPAGALWKAESLEVIAQRTGIQLPTTPFSGVKDKLYWTRWETDVVFDSEVSVRFMLAINRSTVYSELLETQGFEETVDVGFGGVSCVQALTDAGTANLIVNIAGRRGEAF